MRAYQKDGTDENVDGSGARWVDSDGLVAQPLRAIPLPGSNATSANRVAPINAMNGLWHMITLTSQPRGQRGYRRAPAISPKP